ncbi:MAG: septum formation initiator family protein [bacterium]|nr:septum formation initiator family protein [bacterium]
MTWKRFFKSKLFFVVGIVVLAFLSLNLIRAQLKDRAIREEIAKSQDEVDMLEKERSGYEELRTMLNTNEFLEKEARRSLGYAKPGEQVVVIEENQTCKMKNEKCTQGDEGEKQISNPRKWWIYFFGKI